MSRAAKRRAARRRAARRGGTLPLVPLMVGGIVVLGVVAVLLVTLSGGDGGEEVGPQTRPVTVEGAPLTELPEAARDDQIGVAAPALRGEDFAGKPVSITPDGRPKAVVFLAHWCPHCNNEAPRLARYVRETGLPEGVDLYVVATGTSSSKPNYPPETWLEETGLAALDLPTLVDSDGFDGYTAFGRSGFPYLVLLDQDHKVVLRLSGELPEGSFGPLFDALARGETPVDPGLGG